MGRPMILTVITSPENWAQMPQPEGHPEVSWPIRAR